MDAKEQKFWNPYAAGVALGLVLLGSFLVVNQGLGASGGLFRMGVAALHTVAPAHVAATPHMAAAYANGHGALDNFYIFVVIGVFVGGFVSSYAAGRMGRRVLRGPRIGVKARLALAFSGGILMGFAARLARGCTSGQALTGGALLSVGAWVFMLCVFGGGYAFAWFLRKEWT